jgi:ribosomal protein S18 acetylase RimI-like enzyme
VSQEPAVLRFGIFRRSDAATVLSWAVTAEERRAWASIVDPAPDASIFDRWHADPEVHPYELLADGIPIGYGEVWEDREEDEAELARVIVAPAWRGRGFGRMLVFFLTKRAKDAGFDAVWVRVAPGNHAAIATYAAEGFDRTSAEQEAAFNDGQPESYVWMRLTRSNEPPRR